jgi:hypothetical protein
MKQLYPLAGLTAVLLALATSAWAGSTLQVFDCGPGMPGEPFALASSQPTVIFTFDILGEISNVSGGDWPLVNGWIYDLELYPNGKDQSPSYSKMSDNGIFAYQGNAGCGEGPVCGLDGTPKGNAPIRSFHANWGGDGNVSLQGNDGRTYSAICKIQSKRTE